MSKALELKKRYEAETDPVKKEAIKAEARTYKQSLVSGKGLTDAQKKGYYGKLATKPPELDATQEKSLYDQLNVIQRLKGIRGFLDTPRADDLGPWDARIYGAAKWLGIPAPEYAETEAGIGLTPQAIQKVLTGTGGSAKEMEGYARKLPSMDKTAEENIPITEGLIGENEKDFLLQMDILKRKGHNTAPYESKYREIMGLDEKQEEQQQDPVAILKQKAQQRLQEKKAAESKLGAPQ